MLLSRTRIHRGLLSFLMAVVLILSGSIPRAMASPDANTDPKMPALGVPDQTTIVTISQPMIAVGFDESVAEQHGYKIVLVENGNFEASVPANAAKRVRTLEDVVEANGFLAADGQRALAIQESGHQGSSGASGSQLLDTDTATGNCGTSILTVSRAARGKYTINTGFNIKHNAVSYHWETLVTRGSHERHYSWTGGLSSRKTWRNGAGTANGRGVSAGVGTAIATMPAYTGWAITWYGSTCWSGSLSASEYIG